MNRSMIATTSVVFTIFLGASLLSFGADIHLSSAMSGDETMLAKALHTEKVSKKEDYYQKRFDFNGLFPSEGEACQLKGEGVIFDVKPLLGQEFSGYEKILGKPLKTKRTTNRMMAGEITRGPGIGIEHVETRYYKRNGFEQVLVAREERQLDKGSGMNFGLDSQGKPVGLKETSYTVRFVFPKSNAPKDWRQALNRVGLSAEGIEADSSKEGTFIPYQIYEQCTVKNLRGSAGWDNATRTLWLSILHR